MDLEQEARIREKYADAHEIRINQNTDGIFTVSLLAGHRKRRHAHWQQVVIAVQKTDEIKKQLQKQVAAQIFGLTIFLNDNYLVFKNTSHESAIERYFGILMRLHMDLLEVR